MLTAAALMLPIVDAASFLLPARQKQYLPEKNMNGSFRDRVFLIPAFLIFSLPISGHCPTSGLLLLLVSLLLTTRSVESTRRNATQNLLSPLQSIPSLGQSIHWPNTFTVNLTRKYRTMKDTLMSRQGIPNSQTHVVWRDLIRNLIAARFTFSPDGDRPECYRH